MSLILNPLQRYGLWVHISQHEVAPKDLLSLKDIQDKLKLDEVEKWLEQDGVRTRLKSETPSEVLQLEVSLSRAESDLVKTILENKKFTVLDFDWLWPIYEYLKKK